MLGIKDGIRTPSINWRTLLTTQTTALLNIKTHE